MIKKVYRKLYRTWLGKSLTIDEFRYVLVDLLGIKKGDSILVHTSFGNLNSAFSPKEAVAAVMDIVGNDGNILMPFYPTDSKNWLEQGEVFDLRTTPTRSGILSSSFARHPDVKRSLHPIKSMAVWGKDRDYLISTHHQSKTPFDQKSPYYKFIGLKNSKSIGIGVFKNLVVHASEDTIDEYPKYYHDTIYRGRVISEEGKEYEIETPIHKNIKMLPSCEYLFFTKCPGYFEVFYRKRRFYASDAMLAYKHIKELANNNLTAQNLIKKQSYYRKIISRINRI